VTGVEYMGKHIFHAVDVKLKIDNEINHDFGVDTFAEFTIVDVTNIKNIPNDFGSFEMKNNTNFRIVDDDILTEAIVEGKVHVDNLEITPNGKLWFKLRNDKNSAIGSIRLYHESAGFNIIDNINIDNFRGLLRKLNVFDIDNFFLINRRHRGYECKVFPNIQIDNCLNGFNWLDIEITKGNNSLFDETERIITFYNTNEDKIAEITDFFKDNDSLVLEGWLLGQKVTTENFCLVAKLKTVCGDTNKLSRYTPKEIYVAIDIDI